MIFMSPTALSIRYLDKSQRWLELEAGSRDKALDFIEQGLVYLYDTTQSHDNLKLFDVLADWWVIHMNSIRSHPYIFV